MSGRRRDAAAVAVLATWEVAERLLSPLVDGPAAANVVCGLVMAAALWWRRTDPVRATGVVLAGGFASAFAGSPPSDVVASLVIIVSLGFSAGRYLDGHARVATAAALGLGAGLIDVLDYGVEGLLFPPLAVGAAALIGGLLRDRAGLTRELAERTHALDALREARERDAVLDERRRIARELHDVVAHTVSVMVVQAAGARRQLDRDPERARTALRQVRATGEETLGELSRMFGLLHAAPGETGLDAVERIVERTRAAGLDVTLDVAGTPRSLEPLADLALVRVVQEALTNTLKHAGPDATAEVALRFGDDAVDIACRDTGWGDAGPRGEGSRRGHEGMRDRVAAHGGSVQAGPRPAGGYEVRARLPLAREEVPA